MKYLMIDTFFRLLELYKTWKKDRDEIPDFLKEDCRPMQFRGRPRKT